MIPATLSFLFTTCAWAGIPSLGSPVVQPQALPLFDAHIHLADFSAAELYEFAMQWKLDGIVVVGTETSIELQSAYPDYCVSCVTDGPITAETPDVLARALDDGARCIGELGLKYIGMGGVPVSYTVNDPILMEVYALAGSRGVPVNVHINHEDDTIWEFEDALDSHPGTVFVWAHSGDTDPATLGPLLQRHPNLFSDLACRHDIFSRVVREGYGLYDQSIMTPQGTLREDWREIFMRYPDRFIFGTDVAIFERAIYMEEVLSFFRQAFRQLPFPVAARIANRNGRAIYDLPR